MSKTIESLTQEVAELRAEVERLSRCIPPGWVVGMLVREQSATPGIRFYVEWDDFIGKPRWRCGRLTSGNSADSYQEAMAAVDAAEQVIKKKRARSTAPAP